MIKYKRILAAVLAALMAFSAAQVSFAYDTAGDFSSYATAVENQASGEDCSFYAVLAAAGSYAVKVGGESKEKADFSEKKLKSKIGYSDNFGEVLYSAAEVDIGNGYYITGAESLTARDNNSLKRKIKENGGICAVISVPAGGMDDPDHLQRGENGKVVFDNYSTAKTEEFHAFEIVGWDDGFTYGKNKNYKGAWLCKNSYGKEFGDDGYFHLSYRTPLRFASTVAADKLETVSAVRKADRLLLNFKYITAVGFQSQINRRNAEIKLTFNDEKEVVVTRDIVEGYNFIALDEPTKAIKLTAMADGSEVNPEFINCYLTKSKNGTVSLKSPEKDENWDIYADNLDIIEKDGDVTANSDVNGKNVNHKTALSAVDNKVRIKPAEGYYFDENTYVSLIREDYQGKTTTKYGSLGSMDGVGFVNGEVIYDSLNIGSATVTGIKITTDDESRVSSVKLVFTSGSEKDAGFSAEAYADAGLSEKLDDISGREGYYALVKYSGYERFAEDITVTLNDKRTELNAEVNTDGGNLTVSLYIDIPSVRSNIFEIMVDVLLWIGKIFDRFRSK